jgi:hypothetical protein
LRLNVADADWLMSNVAAAVVARPASTMAAPEAVFISG